jgi:competence protein ComFC
MSIFDHFLDILAPYNCLACGREGDLLCFSCLSELPPAPPFDHPLRCLSKVQAATPYQGTAKNLVWQLKASGAQAAARLIVKAMADRFQLPHGALIVPAPTATAHVRQRGYDQARLLAKNLSRQTGLVHLDCLRRQGQIHQVGASRQQRARQLSQVFYIRRPQLIKNASIILVDDVITTGATLETAATTLLAAGAAEVSALTFAQTQNK